MFEKICAGIYYVSSREFQQYRSATPEKYMIIQISMMMHHIILEPWVCKNLIGVNNFRDLKFE